MAWLPAGATTNAKQTSSGTGATRLICATHTTARCVIGRQQGLGWSAASIPLLAIHRPLETECLKDAPTPPSLGVLEGLGSRRVTRLGMILRLGPEDK